MLLTMELIMTLLGFFTLENQELQFFKLTIDLSKNGLPQYQGNTNQIPAGDMAGRYGRLSTLQLPRHSNLFFASAQDGTLTLSDNNSQKILRQVRFKRP